MFGEEMSSTIIKVLSSGCHRFLQDLSEGDGDGIDLVRILIFHSDFSSKACNSCEIFTAWVGDKALAMSVTLVKLLGN